MKDVMIDFETFGNGKNACVIQVGAVYFDRNTGDTGRKFKATFDARQVVQHGGEMDADTIYWWLEQARKAIDSITKDQFSDFPSDMAALNGFLSEADQIWSHATFDYVILTETLKRLNLKPKFSYRSARDIRTLLDLSKFDYRSLPRQGTHHDALDDCLHQIKYCVLALRKLNGISE